MTATPSLVGLYFVCAEYGPAAGRVMGKLNTDCVSVLVESDAEAWQAFVSVATILDWDLFESQNDAARRLAEVVRECHLSC